MKTNSVLLSITATVAIACLSGCGKETGPAGSQAAPVEVIAPGRIPALVDESYPVNLLHVWATWCGPCRAEFPDLVRIYEEYKDKGLNMVLLSADAEDNLELVRNFLAEYGAEAKCYVVSPVGAGMMDAISSEWSGAIPVSFFFDAQGNLAESWEGRHSYQDYARTIRKILQTQERGTQPEEIDEDT